LQLPDDALSNTTAMQVILFDFAPTAAVFVEMANSRTLRKFKLAVYATAYTGKGSGPVVTSIIFSLSGMCLGLKLKFLE
jgi:hypothetical protein